MIQERYINAPVIAGFLLLAIWAHLADEPFTITLATRAVLLALAAVGLNIALGIGVLGAGFLIRLVGKRQAIGESRNRVLPFEEFFLQV